MKSPLEDAFYLSCKFHYILSTVGVYSGIGQVLRPDGTPVGKKAICCNMGNWLAHLLRNLIDKWSGEHSLTCIWRLLPFVWSMLQDDKSHITLCCYAVVSSTKLPRASTLSQAGLHENNKTQFEFCSKMQKWVLSMPGTTQFNRLGRREILISSCLSDNVLNV